MAAMSRGEEKATGLEMAFARYLIKRHIRLCDHHRQVLDKVSSLDSTFTAEAVLDGLGVSRASVYRTLSRLVDALLLNEISRDGHVKYRKCGLG
jgi:Fe2+ or Zn2+ uptake regulation protein